jgi:putative ABC transport system permease protein
MTLQPLTVLDLGIAGLLLAANAAISIGFRLGLERRLAIAAVRMIVQLGAVGFVLKFLFEQGSGILTVAFALLMIAVASVEAQSRQRYSIGSRWQHWGLGTSTLLFCGLTGTLYAMLLVIQTEPWWNPRIILPIFGMVLGNALTSITLVLDTLTTSTRRERTAIEGRLALGATRLGAMREVLASALRTAMLPIINAMAVAGVVSLPGMMTGQILAGVDPTEAGKFQILIMFVISGTTALGALMAGLGAVWLLTDSRHRLRAERLADG